MNDDFYIGWEKKAVPATAKTVHKAVIVLLALALAAPVVLAISQQMISASVFEWGTLKTVSGVLQTKPYPHLLVPRPGNVEAQSKFSTYYLVAPWKFGLNSEAIAPLDGKLVSVKGTLIYRENQTMIETRPEWILASTNSQQFVQSDAPYRNLGKQTFVGEIVDSKCFLGVMNPGQLAPHRACAIRCISGGAPPLLLVRQKEGPAIYLLLVSANGGAVNKQVLDMVAEPVEITGEVERHGEMLVLRSDPATYRRVGR